MKERPTEEEQKKITLEDFKGHLMDFIETPEATAYLTEIGEKNKYTRKDAASALKRYPEVVKDLRQIYLKYEGRKGSPEEIQRETEAFYKKHPNARSPKDSQMDDLITKLVETKKLKK